MVNSYVLVKTHKQYTQNMPWSKLNTNLVIFYNAKFI
jgi:hypothetical protein